MRTDSLNCCNGLTRRMLRELGDDFEAFLLPVSTLPALCERRRLYYFPSTLVLSSSLRLRAGFMSCQYEPLR